MDDATQLGSVQTYLTKETDWSGIHAAEPFPLVELTVVSESKSDYARTDTVEDNAGNTIGEIYERVTTLRIQIAIHTLAGSDHDHKTLGDELDLALAQYVEDGYGALLPDGDGGGMADISVESVEDGRETSSTGESGGSMRLYTWFQDVVCDVTQRLDTNAEYGPLPYVTDIDYPADGDYGGIGDGSVEATPPYD